MDTSGVSQGHPAAQALRLGRPDGVEQPIDDGVEPAYEN
jgi:hypothetical protein